MSSEVEQNANKVTEKRKKMIEKKKKKKINGLPKPKNSKKGIKSQKKRAFKKTFEKIPDEIEKMSIIKEKDIMSSEVEQNANKVTAKRKKMIEKKKKNNGLPKPKYSKKAIKSRKKRAFKKIPDEIEKKSIIKEKLLPVNKVLANVEGAMRSEVKHNVNQINDEKKEKIGNASIQVKKKNDSQEPRSKDEVHPNDRPEEFQVSDCETEKPAVEDVDSRKAIQYSEYIESQKKRGEKLIADVKHYLTINDFQTATNVLSEVCNHFISLYGEMTEECADVYYMFGCALFEFGLKKKDKNEKYFVQKDLTNKNDIIYFDNKATVFNIKVEVTDIDKKKLAKKISVDGKTLDEFKEKSTVKEKLWPEDKVLADEKGGMDDINVFQFARVMLDFAMVIYKKTNTYDSKLKLAEVLMKCWEVSIEDRQFETAIEDISESLETRRLLLE